MTAPYRRFAAAVSCWLSFAACDPEDACDRGYRADHGYCYLSDAETPLLVSDASSNADGGELIQNPNATFGTACRRQSDCGGVAPACGGPMLPFCTSINCMESGSSACPVGWVCLDITKYEPLPPGVRSVCVIF